MLLGACSLQRFENLTDFGGSRCFQLSQSIFYDPVRVRIVQKTHREHSIKTNSGS